MATIGGVNSNQAGIPKTGTGQLPATSVDQATTVAPAANVATGAQPLVDQNSRPTGGVASGMEVNYSEPLGAQTYSVPKPPPATVEYSSPPPPSERTIEVAGTGMGASKKYTMLESEALAVYTTLRDNKGNMKAEDLQKALKEKYGIDADITTVNGRKTLVNKATGNTIAVDTNGNGSLDMGDMQFKKALLDAGIDPDAKPRHVNNPFGAALETVTKAIEASRQRVQELEAAYEKSRAQRAAAAAPAAAAPAAATPTTEGGAPAADGTPGVAAPQAAAPTTGTPAPAAPAPAAAPNTTTGPKIA